METDPVAMYGGALKIPGILWTLRLTRVSLVLMLKDKL
jgi:hypothetical protein